MLRYLLDEHISPAVGRMVRQHRGPIDIEAVVEWQGGVWRAKDDGILLQAAAAAGLTLVTYDQRTIRPLIVRLAQEGQSHRGVIFVDERTLAPNDITGLARALIQLWDRFQAEDWTDRAAYLPRPRPPE